MVGSQTVRFRREMSLGQKYVLQTRLLCWDERAFYVEHRFITKDYKTAKNFVNAIVLVKNTVIGNVGPAKIIEKLQNVIEDELKSRPIPQDVQKWIESNQISSKLLREETNN